jgi:hypothetical protein
VFFQTTELVGYIHCRHPSVLSKSPAGSSADNLEELLLQITEIMLDTVILHRNKLGFDDNLRLDLAQFAGDLSTRTIRDFLTESGHPRRSPIRLPT